jgi:mannosyltransferase
MVTIFQFPNSQFLSISMFWNFLFTYTPLFYFIQSFWRDEAYSVLLASRPLSFIFGKTSIEPPVYYVLLHYWIKLFGTGEIASRSLSLIGFTLATIVVTEWAGKLFKSHWLSKFMPLFFFFNPMLLYYAFEVRAYGWYVFFATLSFFAYDRKKWRLYRIAVILGIYTHLYLGLIPFVHLIHYAVQKKLWRIHKPIALFADPMIRSIALTGVCFIPWIIRLLGELPKFKDSWYFPVNIHLIQSVLGNMFLGYEGTPWYLWGATRVLSLVLFILFCIALIPKQNRKRTLPLFLMIFIPLIVVIGISFVKPLFVNRYLIPVTIAEVLLISFTIKAFPNTIVQKIFSVSILLGVLLFNCWYPQQHKKLDIRKTFEEVNLIKTPKDIVVASDAIIFLETLYYTKDAKSVRLYNPQNFPFPWYIGDALFSPDVQISSYPPYPIRAFFIHTDGTYSIRYKLPNSK